MQASPLEEDLLDDGRKTHRNLKGKSVYYLCDLHSSQSAKGVKRYDRLAQTYQVTFCSYTVFPDKPEYLNSFSLRHDRDNELLCDAIHMIFVELSKLKEIVQKPVTDMTDLEKWAVFFRYADSGRYREQVNEVIASKEVLQMAGEMLMNISTDERERAVYRSRKMFQTDYLSNIATAEDRGRKDGIRIGKQDGIKIGARGKSVEVAIKLLQLHLPLEQIIDVTELPGEDIEKIRQENHI